MPIPIIERFWPKVALNEASGCWEWTARKTPRGYGQMWDRESGKPIYAHRFAYARFVGPIGNLTLDHLCRNPSCCNPIHLEPVPLAENILRGVSPPARNAKKTHCPAGHPYSRRDPRTGYRQCSVCQREANERHRDKRNEHKRSKRPQAQG
jgi:hypothetical protein